MYVCMVLAKENLNILWATDHATVLNFLPGVLVVIKERMRTGDKTTATKLVNMVNAAGDKMSKSTIFRAQRMYSFPS